MLEGSKYYGGGMEMERKDQHKKDLEFRGRSVTLNGVITALGVRGWHFNKDMKGEREWTTLICESTYSRQGESPIQSLEMHECLVFSRNSKEDCVECTRGKNRKWGIEIMGAKYIDLVDPKDFDFSSEWDGKPLQGLEQRIVMIWLLLMGCYCCFTENRLRESLK